MLKLLLIVVMLSLDVFECIDTAVETLSDAATIVTYAVPQVQH